MKRDYYVDGSMGWFVVRTTNHRKAYSKGVREFGRGCTRTVRLATPEETADYVRQRGQATLEDDE
jgi:hypothetical protein